MSRTKSKNDYIILGFLILVTIGVLFILVLFDGSRKHNSGLPGVRTSLSTNVDGVIVCYTLLEKLGISVNRSKKAFLKNALDKTDVLFLLDPIIPLRQDEVKNLDIWLTSGGVLICTNVPNGLHTALDRNNQFSRPYGVSPIPSRNVKHQTSYIPASDINLPLARDISSIYFETERVFDEDGTVLNQSTDKIETLLCDDSGIRIVKSRSGSGSIIVLSDSSFLTNGQIGIDDNSVLTVNLVSYALSMTENKNVTFDEYHFNSSYGQSGFGILSGMLFTTTAGWSILSLTLAGIFFIIYKGRRFGYRRSFEKKQRRSKLEYIYSVGATYRSASANRLTLKIIYDRFRYKVAGLAGLNPNVSNQVIASTLSRRRKKCDLQKCKQAFDKCDTLISREKISERHLLSALKELGSIEMEIFNEHTNSK